MYCTFGTLFIWYELGCCFIIGSNNVSISVIRNIYFRCLLKGITPISYSYHILIAYNTTENWRLVISWCLICLFSYFCVDSDCYFQKRNTLYSSRRCLSKENMDITNSILNKLSNQSDTNDLKIIPFNKFNYIAMKS